MRPCPSASPVIGAIGEQVLHPRPALADAVQDRLGASAVGDVGRRQIDGSDHQKGFQVLPRRWVVERTFGWMMRWRRLVRDYEQRIDVSQAMILVAMGGSLLRRNAHP